MTALIIYFCSSKLSTSCLMIAAVVYRCDRLLVMHCTGKLQNVSAAEGWSAGSLWRGQHPTTLTPLNHAVNTAALYKETTPFKRQAESYMSWPCREGLNTLWKVALKSDSLPGMGSTMRNRARVCKGSCLPPSEASQPSLSELSDCKPRNHGNDYLHFIKQTHRRFRELDCLPSIATLFKLPINLDTFCYFILL